MTRENANRLFSRGGKIKCGGDKDSFFPLLTPGSEEEEEDVKPAAVGGRESEKLLEQIKNILARAVSPKRKENKRRTGEKSAAEPPQTLERLEAL